MFTFITSLLNRSCNNSRPYFQENFRWHWWKCYFSYFTDNPLSILPNSLKKKQQSEQKKTNPNSRKFLMVLLCRQEPTASPAPPQPPKAISQLEAQWVIQSLNCSPDILKRQTYFCFLSSSKIPKEYIFLTVFIHHMLKWPRTNMIFQWTTCAFLLICLKTVTARDLWWVITQ